MKTLNNLAVMAKIKLDLAKGKVKSFIKNEEGDTNFISVLILLGIGLILAAIFLSFKDEILSWVETTRDEFFAKGNSTKRAQ